MTSFPVKKDHRPFGGLGLKLIYGKQADGSFVNIADVPNGLGRNLPDHYHSRPA
jgi:hypothetical protein